MLAIRIPTYHFKFSLNKSKVFLGNMFMREPGYSTSSMTIIMMVVPDQTHLTFLELIYLLTIGMRRNESRLKCSSVYFL